MSMTHLYYTFYVSDNPNDGYVVESNCVGTYDPAVLVTRWWIPGMENKPIPIKS